jgi:ferrous iron transport protein A
MQSAINLINTQTKGIIHQFDDEKVSSKLLSMGILPGSVIEVVRKAPFGGTFYVKVNGYNFALRSNELSCILLD